MLTLYRHVLSVCLSLSFLSPSSCAAGLNSLSVMLAEQSAKQYRPMTTPIHTHLSTGVFSPLQTSLQLIHTAYTRVSRCSTTSSEHTHFALYLDNIQITLPLLSLLLHTVTVVSCWLTRGFNHTIPSSHMVPAVHLLFEEGVACIAAVREIVGVVNEVTPRSLGSSTFHSPHWLLTESTQRTHSEIKESLDYLEVRLFPCFATFPISSSSSHRHSW